MVTVGVLGIVASKVKIASFEISEVQINDGSLMRTL